MGSILLTLLPIAVILCMLIIWKKPADISGIVGWLVVSVVAIFFFQTSLEVIFRSSVAGLIKSFPVSLIVLTSLLQMAFMEKTGALKRIIIFIKTISIGNKAVQIMMINIGFGTLMVAVGATPVSLLPPILIAMGYSTYVAIALPSIGYDSLCTYALLGAPIVVFVDLANGYFKGIGHAPITLVDAGKVFFIFLPVVSTLIGFSMLWIVGKWKAIKEGWLPCLTTGVVIGIVSYFTNRIENLVVLTGVICGLAVILVMALFLKLSGSKIIDKSLLSKEELEYEKKYPLWKALSPWVILIVVILALNIPRGLFDVLYGKNVHSILGDLNFSIKGLSADPKELIKTRLLWNAYTWIFVSILLSMAFIRPTANQIKETVKVWWKRAPRPVFAAAIFFSIGEIMNMSGFGHWGSKVIDGKTVLNVVRNSSNMVFVLADASYKTFHSAYGFISGFIGLLGGFITGSEASTIGMFGNYALSTANYLKLTQNGMILVAAALAFGGGLASVISPAKLQNAAASIDKLGEENQVIRVAFAFSLILTAITAAFALVILKLNILG